MLGKKNLIAVVLSLLLCASLISISIAEEPLDEKWNLVWSDEFGGTELNMDYWNYDIGWGPFDNGWGNFELQYYTPENVSVEDGKLIIKVTEEERTVYEADGKPFTTYYSSGRINTKNKVMPQYGRIEVSAKLLEGDAIWPAVWMLGKEWPEELWPDVGEIDIVELLGQEPNKIYGTVHSPLSEQNGFQGYSSTYVLNEGTFADGFHEYVVEWDENTIQYYIDGIPYHTVNKDVIIAQYGEESWVFDNQFYFIMNVAVGGFFPGSPNENTIVPNQMEVDYIRLYEEVEPTVPQLNLQNGTFDNALNGWDTYIHSDAAASITVVNGEANINVNYEGNEFWSLQLNQGPFQLENAQTYTVQFDARSDVARQLEVVAENENFTKFVDETLNLTTQMNTYTISFTMPANEEVSLKLLAGKIGEIVGVPHQIYIDNVRFYEGLPVTEVSKVTNGTFEGALTSWDQYVHFDAGAAIQAENNEVKISVSNVGAESWGVQLYQGNLDLTAGKQYTVEFDARTDQARDIQVIIDNAVYHQYLNQNVSINSMMSTYQYTFTMSEDDNTSLKFMLGNVNGAPSTPHQIYIDNVKLYEN
ncbi:carbohydrate binding domain-containing protein [Chengkuizengella axinellae]|uniref:Family 16 glycosylhydrolase n=1 Tax=Chengkuizengella axinellae TaxID=3064388 RepID=A0ABT9J300_9BACL|nr:family 16 glycosylhydrolase [Chengkuizengella sp. 2205SS18-9]MDP5275995.1 family 16 glycosylhydrolase [Chengkuizengella sp. 2205SS18-9]